MSSTTQARPGETLPARQALELASAYAPLGGLDDVEAEYLSCPACRSPLTVLKDFATVGCLELRCRLVGKLFNVVDLADRYAVDHGDPNPAGRVRPVREVRQGGPALPVPWLTPVIGRVAFWSFVHGPRLIAAQERWWCQVCGEALDAEAVAVVDQVARFYTAAAAHQACAAIAARVCPVLSAASARLCPVEWADITGLPIGVDPAAPEAAALRRPVAELAAPTLDWRIPLVTMITRTHPAGQ